MRREQDVKSQEQKYQAASDQLRLREDALCEREKKAAQLAEKAAADRVKAEETRESLKDKEVRLGEVAAKIETARELARMRQPFLEELAMTAAEELAWYAGVPPGMRMQEHAYNATISEQTRDEHAQLKEYYRAECLRLLSNSNAVLIVSDDEFKARAKAVIDRFVRDKCEWNVSWPKRHK